MYLAQQLAKDEMMNHRLKAIKETPALESRRVRTQPLTVN